MFLLMGFAFTLFGVNIFFDPEYDSLKYGKLNYGEGHQLFGLFSMALGGLAIFSVFKKYMKNK